MTTPSSPERKRSTEKLTPLTDPDNVMWVIETPAPDVPEPEATVASSGESADDDMPDFRLADHVPGMSFVSRMPPDLQAYWLTGPGAAKVRWGTEGSFRRCVREMRDYFPQNPEGLCANLYHEATGHWPGEKRDK